MEYNSVLLRNSVEMPRLILGCPLILSTANISKEKFFNTISTVLNIGIRGLDTSHDYGRSEDLLGTVLSRLMKKGLDRNSFFLTTKIGNGQQIEGNIEKYVDDALRKLKLDQIDTMLLHWPLPDVYLRNWEKLTKIYEKGKIKAIGISNGKIRHLEKIYESGLMLPHILQTEIHPLHTCELEYDYCVKNDIALQACTSLCSMVPMIKENDVLLSIASERNKTLPQIILRWHIQRNISPIFRSFNDKHLKEMADVFDFSLNDVEMKRISSQNINYRFHPESLNCPGF